MKRIHTRNCTACPKILVGYTVKKVRPDPEKILVSWGPWIAKGGAAGTVDTLYLRLCDLSKPFI